MLGVLYINPSSTGSIVQGILTIFIIIVPVFVAFFFGIRLLIKWLKKKYDEL